LLRFDVTSTGSGPNRARGNWDWKATASVTALPGIIFRARSSQPVVVVRSFGVPVSEKSWASKWERDKP
jgi:hypothetical protein